MKLTNALAINTRTEKWSFLTTEHQSHQQWLLDQGVKCKQAMPWSVYNNQLQILSICTVSVFFSPGFNISTLSSPAATSFGSSARNRFGPPDSTSSITARLAVHMSPDDIIRKACVAELSTRRSVSNSNVTGCWLGMGLGSAEKRKEKLERSRTDEHQT